MEAPIVLLGLCALLDTSCDARFNGPYSCEAGYASCLSPEKNLCETRVTDDGLNCGACGRRCALGGICKDEKCAPGASTLRQVSSLTNPLLAVNEVGVYWSSGDSGNISRISLDGQTLSTVTSMATGSGSTGTPFALDRDYVYFWAENALARIPSLGGTPAWFAPGSVGRPAPAGLAVDDTRIVWVGYDSNSTGQVLSVPLAGGAPRVLESFAAVGERSRRIVLTPTRVLFVVGSENGPPTLASVGVEDGGSAAIPLDGQYRLDALVADSQYVYVVGGGDCSCMDNADDVGQRPRVRVARYPFDGGKGQLLAELAGVAASAAVDGEFVYVATETTIFKVPVGGGVPVPLADNLDPGRAPFLCTKCGNYSNKSMAIAIDATNVYIADAAPGAGSVLVVKK